MGKEATAYIFSFDSKSGVFTLTSSKDQLTIDSKHKKYEWLKGQEAGRVIKISATGRWNSSRDYDNLYQSINPKKKVLKKSKTSKTNTDKPGEYCFSFIENEFVLTDQNGVEIKITSKHKKFEWLQSQDSGRVIKISEKGRWNSSKDYDGLYEKVQSSNKKQTKQSVSKPTTQKPKTDSSGEINKLKEEIKNLQSTIQNQRDELKRLGSNYNELKKEKDVLRAELEATIREKRLQKLKKKSQPSKPKPVAKQYRARITATLSYYHKAQSLYPGKRTEALDVKITTHKLFKKPGQSFFKSYLKLAANKSHYRASDDLGMDIYSVSGLRTMENYIYYEKFKISGIEFISIDEYY